MTQEEYFIAGYEKLFGQKPPDFKIEQFRDHLKMIESIKDAEKVRILHGRNRDYVMYLPKDV
mgnify:CR=1 FL=1